MSGSNGDKNAPVIMATIHVDIMQNGSVQVRNFPKNPMQAMSALQMAQTVLFGYFMQQAASGELPGQKIIRPGLGIDAAALKVKP